MVDRNGVEKTYANKGEYDFDGGSNRVHLGESQNFDPNLTSIQELGIHTFTQFDWAGTSCPTDDERWGPYFEPPVVEIKRSYDPANPSEIKTSKRENPVSNGKVFRHNCIDP